jgi:hypothetical protein
MPVCMIGRKVPIKKSTFDSARDLELLALNQENSLIKRSLALLKMC